MRRSAIEKAHHALDNAKGRRTWWSTQRLEDPYDSYAIEAETTLNETVEWLRLRQLGIRLETIYRPAHGFDASDIASCPTCTKVKPVNQFSHKEIRHMIKHVEHPLAGHDIMLQKEIVRGIEKLENLEARLELRT